MRSAVCKGAARQSALSGLRHKSCGLRSRAGPPSRAWLATAGAAHWRRSSLARLTPTDAQTGSSEVQVELSGVLDNFYVLRSRAGSPSRAWLALRSPKRGGRWLVTDDIAGVAF